MRGRNRSKPLEVLVEEAEKLAEQGVKELVVVAEDSTAYGLDLYRERRIHELLDALAKVEGIEWIRLMYAYPHTVRPELTEVMRQNPKILPYLDIPVQHINGDMLRAMRRGVSAEQVRGILERLREEVPGIAIRTTFIVGFPGETDAAFAELRDFVKDFRFERMGAFCYSKEEGTPAHDLSGEVSTEQSEERRAELMELQRDIIFARNRELVGSSMQILVDGRSEGGGFVGRTHADAPEVDCLVRLDEEDLHSGDLVERRILSTDGYDLKTSS
jgi:ribosomal protein S12 methylthiotransferase